MTSQYTSTEDFTEETTFDQEGVTTNFQDHWAYPAVEEFVQEIQLLFEDEGSEWVYTISSSGEAEVIERTQGVQRQIPLRRSHNSHPYHHPTCIGCGDEVLPRDPNIRCPRCRNKMHLSCGGLIYANRGKCIYCNTKKIFDVPLTSQLNYLTTHISNLEEIITNLKDEIEDQ